VLQKRPFDKVLGFSVRAAQQFRPRSAEEGRWPAGAHLVPRKSFLAAITGPASLAADLYAAAHRADFIRPHDPAALRDGLAVMTAFGAES
jgi:dihydropteroate synthase